MTTIDPYTAQVRKDGEPLKTLRTYVRWTCFDDNGALQAELTLNDIKRHAYNNTHLCLCNEWHEQITLQNKQKNSLTVLGA